MSEITVTLKDKGLMDQLKQLDHHIVGNHLYTLQKKERVGRIRGGLMEDERKKKSNKGRIDKSVA